MEHIMTIDQVNQLQAMLKSPGWGVFTTNILPAWMSSLHRILESPESTEKQDWMAKGSIATIRNVIGFQTIIEQDLKETD